jgi:hypothetical protein
LITADAFKATVQDFIERQDGQALPRPGELMLLGHAEGAGWKRARLKPPLAWVPRFVVRGLILEWKADRLAIIVAADAPRQFRVAFASRDAVDPDGTIADPRLARLVAAAAHEWRNPRRAPRPLRTLFGRPWPIPVLSAALLLELGPGLIRLSRGIPLASPPVYFLEVVLVVGAVVMMWRGSRIGYGLALVLSAVQLVYPVTVYAPYVSSRGLGAVAPGLLLAWSYPALIWLVLALLYVDRVRRAATIAPREGAI